MKLIGSYRRQTQPRSEFAVVLGSLVIALAAFSGPSQAKSYDGDATGGEGEPSLEESYEDGFLPFAQTPQLGPGTVSVVLSGDKTPNFQFDATCVEWPGMPGSYILPLTPLGSIALLYGGDWMAPSYQMVFQSTGFSMSLSEDPLSNGYIGHESGVQGSVNQKPVQQNTTGGATLEVFDNAQGIKGQWKLRITAPCKKATFRQFISKTITWEGTLPNGQPTPPGGQVHPGPEKGSANNGKAMNTDGKTTYVDSNEKWTGANTPRDFNNAPMGDYPGRTENGKTFMEDAPNKKSAEPTKNDITAKNPGADVKTIIVTSRFTTYILCDGKVTRKIQWTHVEKLDAAAGGPHPTNGDFGGPSTAPKPANSPFKGEGSPTDVPADKMDDHHQKAYDEFTAATHNYSGEPSQGGY